MKRRADTQPGIKAGFAKAKQISNKQAKEVQLPGLEKDVHSSPEVPRVYIDGEVSQKYEQYRQEYRSMKDKLLHAAEQRRPARSSSGGAAPSAGTPASSAAAGAADAAAEASPTTAAAAEADADAAATAAADLQVLAERWQSRAAFVVHHLEAWAGSRVALQQQLQEMLMHIVINYDLHPDPRISVRAYNLLSQNLAAHPPLKPAAILQEGQPRQLLRSPLSWNPLARSALDDTKETADAKERAPMGFREIFGGARFSLLQSLVRNAVQLVTGNSNSSCYNVRPPGLPQASTGKALLLLWLVQLLQADAHVRLAVFEEHMASCKDRDADEVRRVKGRAASVLSESLLHKLMQDDSFGWREEDSDSETGRHRLVRDLLVIVATSPDDAAAAAAAGATSLGAAAAAAAAGLAPVTPATPPAAAAAAAAADSSSDAKLAAAAVVAAAAAVRPVSASDVISASRRLLLLLFQIFTGMEAAGAYASGSGAHHAARGVASQNDRWWLDNVLLMALTGTRMMQPLRESAGPVRAAAALQRVLQALPAVHGLRLISVGVAEAIGKRPYDARDAAASPHVESLYEYHKDQGKGFAQFRRGDALETMKALAERLKWAFSDVLGGKEAFTLMLCSLVSVALPGKQLRSEERADFVRVAQTVLDGVHPLVVQHVLQLKDSLLPEACAAQEQIGAQVLLSLGAALQLLQV
uniref:Uncharacterized protein n=1 Tax=Tetradesmus obliquus TaxID=3088 RepID=A0A383WPY4_TETOB|eukprot:jgi/Sobl393_1/6394/SZX79495.1